MESQLPKTCWFKYTYMFHIYTVLNIDILVLITLHVCDYSRNKSYASTFSQTVIDITSQVQWTIIRF